MRCKRAEAWLLAFRLVTEDAGAPLAGGARSGGSLPGTLPTTVLAVQTPRVDAVAAALRHASPPVVCRIQKEHLLFDPRTALPEQDEALIDNLARALQQGEER